MPRPDAADLFDRYGIAPNRRSRGRLDLWLRCHVRRFRLVRNELVASSPMSWPKRLATWRRGFTANSALVYRLDVNDPREYVSDWDYYLSGYRFNGFFNPIVGNKLVLSQILAGYGLPHPKVFGVVRRGRAVAIGPRAAGDARDDGWALLEAWAADGRPLVLRPHWSGAGEGVFFLQRDAHGWQVNRRPAGNDDVHRLVATLDRYIVTAFVDQAGYAATIYPATANTLRVMTICDGDGCFVAAVAHRFGSRRSGSIDNWHRGRGGLNAPVDWSRGSLGRAVTLGDDGRLVEHERHPDTGSAIEGVTIPGLERALAGVLDAARCLPEATLIGWDMLMTDDGYSILEANSPPGITVWQTHAPLLRNPRVARFFAAPPA